MKALELHIASVVNGYVIEAGDLRYVAPSREEVGKIVTKILNDTLREGSASPKGQDE